MYNIHMNNKTNNIFRFKVKRPRQTFIQLDKEAETDKEEGSQSFARNRVGFSSQYITLAKKFNIKIVADQSQRKIKNIKQIQSLNLNQKHQRIKTQFSKTRSRYNMWQTPTQKLQLKHCSFWLNEKSNDLSSRRQKQALVKLNKNTVYNDMFFRLKTQEEPDSLIQQQPLKLNIKKGEDILTNLGKHCQKLFSIKQALQKKEINDNELIRQIKLYVLREDGASISKLDSYFVEEKVKKQVKELVVMERMALLAIVTNTLSHHNEQLVQECGRTIQIILGFWYQVLNNTYSQNIFQLQIQQNSPIKDILQTLSQAKLLTKSNIKLLLQTVAQKLSVLYKHFKPFYKQIVFLINYSHSISINRAFYQLLTLYAGFVTHYENQHKIILDNVSFFATCPSPYLVKSSGKSYTLVVDLDQTLIYSPFVKNNKQKGREKLEALNRPGSMQFISQLAKYYEIVLFTTAVESYARQVTKQFIGIDHFLFRQHAVRVKSGFIKDLSRLGRDLTKVVIVDDTANNFKLQKQNAIKVNSWKGDPNDTELFEMKELLLKLAQEKPSKVTIFLQKQRILQLKNSSILPLKPIQQKPPV